MELTPWRTSAHCTAHTAATGKPHKHSAKAVGADEQHGVTVT
nr:hypothetical protein [Streptomyces sp. SID4919]